MYDISKVDRLTSLLAARSVEASRTECELVVTSKEASNAQSAVIDASTKDTAAAALMLSSTMNSTLKEAGQSVATQTRPTSRSPKRGQTSEIATQTTATTNPLVLPSSPLYQQQHQQQQQPQQGGVSVSSVSTQTDSPNHSLSGCEDDVHGRESESSSARRSNRAGAGTEDDQLIWGELDEIHRALIG